MGGGQNAHAARETQAHFRAARLLPDGCSAKWFPVTAPPARPPVPGGARPRPFARRLLLALLYSYVACLVLVCLLLRGISTYSWATVPALVDGTAYRPFVTRALLPAIVRGVVRATPALRTRVEARLASSLASTRPGWHLDRALAVLGWTPADAYVHMVATGVMLACFLALPWVLRRLLAVFYDLPPPVVDVAPVFGLLALPLFFLPYARYLYDPGTLLLWAVGLLLVAERRHVTVWLLLPVLAYHKETAVLLPLLVALREWELAPRGRVALVAVAQLLVVALVRLWLHAQFAANPGGVVLLAGPGHLRELAMTAFRRPPYVPLVVAMLWALVQSGWRESPRYLQNALPLVLLPLVLLALAFGYVDELRDYYEAWAIVFLIAVPAALTLLRATPARIRAPFA